VKQQISAKRYKHATQVAGSTQQELRVLLHYVVTLLCTLGAFSIYPMLIMGRSLSWRTAAAKFAAVACLGIVAGVGTSLLQSIEPA
jgi:hypothetical protein